MNSPRFNPKFRITPAIAGHLMSIEGARQAVLALPINPKVLAALRETARLGSTHYSTMIVGNRLSLDQVARVIGERQHFPGRKRDQDEVKGYYAALDAVERQAARREPVSEITVQHLHALVMGSGRSRVRPTPYRDGQNVIRDARTGAIVYLPPESRDVPLLMRQLIEWINQPDDLPVPLRAAITHDQFATIHPYYDGNGRTARLLTTLVLHLGGYDLKGLYALDEYYAQDLPAYYQALNVGPSHNYHLGRAGADITPWITYFVAGMADSLERVRAQAALEATRGGRDASNRLRELDARQRKALTLFVKWSEITAKDLGALFGLAPRSATLLCQTWVTREFLQVADPARKSRRYRLHPAYLPLVRPRLPEE